MNINTPEFWNDNFEVEWDFVSNDKKPYYYHEYRWYYIKFNFVSCDLPFKGSVLDVGCGVGHFCRYVKARNPELKVYGIDFSPKGIKYGKKLARKSGTKIKLLIGDAQDLPFGDNVFDAVTSLDVIEHLDSPDKHLQEIKRVLKPQGKAYIVTPYKGRVATPKDHVQEWTPKEFSQLLLKNNLTGSMAFPTRDSENSHWFLSICQYQ
jgi:ubiquinone/menaquinone biosynthesis C-methylase UbiE